ncbi:pyrimidine nucleotide-sugar transmembrane transporter [Aureococcus anophagefferens]|nr:pyrimidine nucleotide-sugar transmembrane transporter [Aureococcus anophagefferens]
MDDPKPATARIAVLAAMLFQNVAYTLLRSYSQGVLHENYSYAEVLVLAEIAKTAVAGAVACRGEANPLATLAALLKILSTAGCSAVFLRRALSPAKWRALASLTVGAILVSRSALGGGGAAEDAGDRRVAVVGLAAVLTEVTLSGFASAYFEGVIKASGKRLSRSSTATSSWASTRCSCTARSSPSRAAGRRASGASRRRPARSSGSARRAVCWSR